MGPVPSGPPRAHPYTHPAAGWGAAKGVLEVLLKEKELVAGTEAVFRMNQADGGFDCPGCAWPDDETVKMDICENGMKHVAWEMTHKRTTREFFAKHTVSELYEWNDHDLEAEGRLTEPMVYDPATDHYVPISWADAFKLFGDTVRSLDSPHQASYYTSGRLSNEATFLYQLMVRELGTNNMPDCSNMCHEASGRALKASIGTGVGTCDLKDWQTTEALFVMGVNVATNAPRMLTYLAEAYRRGAKIVHVNPLIEAGATETIIPHEIIDMITMRATPTSNLNLQVRIGGDMALLRGMAKAVLEWSATDPKAIDPEFIERYTQGFEEYKRLCQDTSWDDIEAQSGLSRADIIKAAQIYRDADRSIISWCLGVTQHEHGVSTIREIVNLLLLRGNLGREGAGPSPVRGHSNVQGNRTCGIDNHPSEAFLDRLDEACGITSPREAGLDTIGTIQAMSRGDVKVFVGMGGNFALASPDNMFTYDALRRCELTVQVSTKLNRSHLVHGKKALILPCLGRTEKDQQKAGAQSVSVEDSMSMVHLSRGSKRPASKQLLSEPAIVSGLARAALPDSETPWEWYIEDYDRIRDTMSKALYGFEDFNRRVRGPMGFRIRQPARELVFLTPSGRAEFCVDELPDVLLEPGFISLGTMRSHDQWNTSIYSDNDRYRGIRNLRTLVFMNKDDMRERGLEEFSPVNITTTAKDGSKRSVYNFLAVAYDVPRSCALGYMPELTPLIGLCDYSLQSDQPLMKQLKAEIVAAV
ncbi:FdhF/YdeP family oxidoreductase [Streptomyces polyrhachis]|uniref:FdhF/YdeP family oxidoreductase n=1 Tax=Streptomyces polyrhachis TaxID=1282885 RepID=A0ABW2GPD6_9ACTN